MRNHKEELDRRRFLARAALAPILWEAGVASTGLVQGETAICRTLATVLEKGRKIGIGSARIEGPKEAEVRTHGTWTLVYTAGKAGIRPGGGLRVGVRHGNSWWTTIQNAEPAEDGYLSVTAPEKVPIQVFVECKNWSKRFFNAYFPVQNIVEVVMDEPGLRPGETIRINYGDTSAGSKGMLLQPFNEENFLFATFVDALGDQKYLPLENSPGIRILAGQPEKLAIIAKSNAVCGSPSVVTVRAEDRFGNPAPSYRGTVQLECTDQTAVLPPPHSFTASDKGAYRFDEIVLNGEGTHVISATDGRLNARSNPVSVSEVSAELQHLWGDIHGHTIFSDGRGTVQEYYEFARDVAALDFSAVSDHAFEITNEMWKQSKATTNAYNEDGKFVTFNAYEWSGKTDVGGDHNVYWLDDDPPIYRSDLFYDPNNLQMDHDLSAKVTHIKPLYTKLRGHLRNKNVFCIPHRGGRGANPEWHDPEVERLVETYCEHFRSEEWARGFLQKGHRLGLMGSGDGHYCNPGHGFLFPRGLNRVGEGLIAVLAQEQTRDSIFRAMYDRHCYATSGDRIILDFRVDGHLMGSEINATKSPEIVVEIKGTDDVELVEIRRDSKIVHTEKPNLSIVRISWVDLNFQSDRGCYYDVHVVQKNGEEALTSPVWLIS